MTQTHGHGSTILQIRFRVRFPIFQCTLWAFFHKGCYVSPNGEVFEWFYFHSISIQNLRFKPLSPVNWLWQLLRICDLLMYAFETSVVYEIIKHIFLIIQKHEDKPNAPQQCGFHILAVKCINILLINIFIQESPLRVQITLFSPPIKQLFQHFNG